MLMALPTVSLIIVNVLAWLVIHLAVPWLALKLPGRLFTPDQWLYRPRSWESRGRLYERLFAIRSWKDRLPEGAALFRGSFRKRSLRAKDPIYLKEFERETCRGEAVHWIVMFSSLFFFLLNPWPAGVAMIAYAVTVNLPCILTQRYNRARLERLIGRIED